MPKKIDSLFRREKAPSLETRTEAGLESTKETLVAEAEPKEKVVLVEKGQAKAPRTGSGIIASPVESVIKSATQQQVENILAEDLAQIYADLPQPIQQVFKAKGEEVAIKITGLLKKTKVKVKEIIKLIRAWLMIIPGVNKYFLEQEVKIKADKIIDLQRPK